MGSTAKGRASSQTPIDVNCGQYYGPGQAGLICHAVPFDLYGNGELVGYGLAISPFGYDPSTSDSSGDAPTTDSNGTNQNGGNGDSPGGGQGLLEATPEVGTQNNMFVRQPISFHRDAPSLVNYLNGAMSVGTQELTNGCGLLACSINSFRDRIDSAAQREAVLDRLDGTRALVGAGGLELGVGGLLENAFASAGLTLNSSNALAGVEPASQALLDAVAARRTVQIATEGSEEMRYLDMIGAEANVGGPAMDNILLRPNPSKAAVLEEFLHGTQARLGIIDRLGIGGAEYQVKDFMIRHAGMLGLGAEDVARLQTLRDMGL